MKPFLTQKKWVAYGLLLFLIIIFWHSYQSELRQIHIQNLYYLFPLIILQILFYLTNGLYNKVLYRAFSVNLHFKEWFGLSVINTLGNLLMPFRGGVVTNALYLKKRHQFEYHKFIATLSAVYLLVFSVNAAFGLVFLFLETSVVSILRSGLIVFFILTLTSCVSIMLWTPKIKHSFIGILGKVIEGINSWQVIKTKKGVVLSCVYISIANVFLMTGIAYCNFRLIGERLTFSAAIVLSVFSSFSLLVSITPGNLGVREMLTAFSASLFAIGPAQAVAATLLDRAVNFILSLVLGIGFSRSLIENDAPLVHTTSESGESSGK